MDPVGRKLERRDALKVMGAALALPVLPQTPAQGPVAQGTPMTSQTQGVKGGPRGGPWDPDMLHPSKNWPRKLSTNELLTLSALCDTIIPADAKSPSASAVGVPAWINEYVSAPYEGQQRDLIRVRGGLAWLNLESTKRFGKGFRLITTAQRTQICDDICYLPKAKPEFQAAARFFDQVRDLTAVGFYTTQEGMRDLGYIGNVALPKFPEVSKELRERLGL
ncbi:MAG TPA: gluconate 2-dehydrogenase subunit 3 family protein [Gemmatimonadales bacterium]|nr:gluconate 2-dehydrogenase subunit 3 family protein [Gemmatimonadales bacterium]